MTMKRTSPGVLEKNTNAQMAKGETKKTTKKTQLCLPACTRLTKRGKGRPRSLRSNQLKTDAGRAEQVEPRSPYGTAIEKRLITGLRGQIKSKSKAPPPTVTWSGEVTIGAENP